MLRKEKVVGKFVEFFGEGAASLAVPDRATIANMAPEYGATMGFFPVDDATVDYLRATGRTAAEIDAFAAVLQGAGPVRHAARRRDRLHEGRDARPRDRSSRRSPDRSARRTASSSAASSRRSPSSSASRSPRTASAQPADKLARALLDAARRGRRRDRATTMPPLPATAQPRDVVEMVNNRPTPDRVASPPAEHVDIGNGDVLIAAITSCTNTSNPSVLLAAGLLAKKAVEKGLTVKPHIKTSLAPGSRVVTDYLTKAGLLPYLEKLGFGVAAYGCTTCIGNAGDLDARDQRGDHQQRPRLRGGALGQPQLRGAHPSEPQGELPRVAAARRRVRDRRHGAEGPRRPSRSASASDGPVYLQGHLADVARDRRGDAASRADPATYRRLYGDLANANPMWRTIAGATGQVYDWPTSTYIAKPPFFDGFTMTTGRDRRHPRRARARHLRRLGHDRPHLARPARSSRPRPPACTCMEHGVSVADFNSYGSRRGNHEVMMRGTFANVRIKNLMLPPQGRRHARGRRRHAVPAVAARRCRSTTRRCSYIAQGTPTVVFGGEEYGTGSSRDWAAKGTQLLGVKAVVAKSFERIHRSNLVGMGVLPLPVQGQRQRRSRSASRATRRSTSPASKRASSRRWT